MNRDESNAILALKNAWMGALEATDRLREMAPAVAGLPDDTSVAALDLDTYRRVSIGQANAAQALRGLIEALQARASKT